jgi:hypothetical protein
MADKSLDMAIEREIFNHAGRYEGLSSMSREFAKNSDPDILKKYAGMMGYDETSAEAFYEAALRTPPQALVHAMRDSSKQRYKSLGEIVKANYDALVKTLDDGGLVGMARGVSGMLKSREEIETALKEKDSEKLRKAYLGTFTEPETASFVKVIGSEALNLLAGSYMQLSESIFLSQFAEEGKIDSVKIRDYLMKNKDDKVYAEAGRGLYDFRTQQIEAAEKAKKKAEQESKKKPGKKSKK